MQDWGTCMQTMPNGDKIPTLKCFEVIFANVLTMAVSLAVLALFVMLIVGGFKFMTSGGDPKATASGQQTMTYAIVGILLMALAYLIFMIIGSFTGVNILHFEIPTT